MGVIRISIFNDCRINERLAAWNVAVSFHASLVSCSDSAVQPSKVLGSIHLSDYYMALKHNLRIKKHNWTNKFYISEHHLLTKHKIDWDSAECVTYITNYHQQLTLESWYTNLKQKPLNRCQKLPAPYKRLIHDLK